MYNKSRARCLQITIYFMQVFLLTTNMFGKENLPIIKATSSIVDIKIDSDCYIKGGWILDPSKKPDVFSIGSKWLYDTKKVSFITDIDSISFDIRPDSKFDFIVLLNEQTRCYIQVTTLGNPIFMSNNIVFSIIIGYLILCVIIFLFKDFPKLSKLTYVGYLIPFLFWIMTVISGRIQGNYHHFKNVISQLGAIGTKSEVFTSSSLLLLSFLGVLFSFGFYKAAQKLKISVLPALLSLSMPLSMVWTAIFTLGNEFHNLGGILPFLMIFNFAFTYLLWKNDDRLSNYSRISLLCFFISLLIFTRFVKPCGYEYEGLIQRTFYLAWSIWMISTTYNIMKISLDKE